MPFELGKLISNGVERLVRRGPARQTGAKLGRQAVRDAAEVFGKDQLIKSAARPTEEAVGKLVKALPKATGEKPVTFLTYKAMDNELSPYIAQHLDKLETVGSSEGLNILAYADFETKNRSSLFGTNWNFPLNPPPGSQFFVFQMVGTNDSYPTTDQSTFVEELQFQGTSFDEPVATSPTPADPAPVSTPAPEVASAEAPVAQATPAAPAAGRLRAGRVPVRRER